jgi:hypothetical protein
MVTAPTSLLDPTGKTDVADKLQKWIGGLPNGTSVNDMTTAVIPPGVYLHEGGSAGAVTFGKRFFSLEASGATFVQRTKKPFAVVPDPSNGNSNVAGLWDIVYKPTNAVTRTFDGWLAGATAYQRATDKCKLLNRGRSFFSLRKCLAVRLRGIKTIGAAGLDPSYNDDYEAQNGINVHGCLDTELDECDVRQMFGNGLEANAFIESNGAYTAPLGLWVHDSNFSDFGRQAASLTYGGRFIWERCDLAGSVNGRSLIDMEPTTNRNPSGQDATVEGLYVLNCSVGKHRLGMVAAGLTNGDVRAIRVAGCRGQSIGISGTSFARAVIFEDNADTDTWSSPNMCKFAMGPQWGSQNIIVRRNKNIRVTEAVVKFHEGNGGVQNYLVAENECGGRPQFIDYNRPPWSGKFIPFTLPTPAHALRDL